MTDLIETAARTAHEVNRAYCVSLGDHSQPPWAQAPSWQRDSALAGIRAIKANPAITPAESHAGWFDLKAKDGWVHGATKDPDKKTHPCMVPYDKLPEDQKVKDALFGAVARGVLGI